MEKEKEALTEELIKINDEINKLKEINSILEHKIDSYVCNIIVRADSEDPVDNMTRFMTEL